MPRSHVRAAPESDSGPKIETELVGDVHVPSTVVRGMREDGAIQDVQVDRDGALEVSAKTLAEEIAIAQRMIPPYARNAQDQMEVRLQSSQINLPVSMTWLNGNNYAGMYGGGAPAAMDAREQHREMTVQTFNQSVSRWSFT